MNVIQGLVPPGGWHYLQEGTHRIESTSYPDLQVAVMHWRLENHRDVGDVRGDVDRYICAAFPRQCQNPTGGGPTLPAYVPPAQSTRFVDRIASWAVDAANSGIAKELVTAEEAQRRAGVCLACPKNTTWENSCPACVTSAQRMMTILRQGKDLPNLAPRLHGCSALNHDNRTAVWIKKELLRRSPEQPAACWILK